MIENKLVCIGKIGSPFGINGWVKLFSYTENTTNIFKYQPWIFKINDKYQKFNITSWKKFSSKLFIVKIETIHNRSMAHLITNLNIMLFKNQLPKLEKDEYYLHEIIGLQVFNIKNIKLGEIIGCIQTKCNDILVIKSQKKNGLKFQEYLIPFIQNTIIKKINKNFNIIVDWNPNF
ncbi:MAG: ribosome maturation factor RimM [Wigglesworthia glossinidia]|nr:ribosome maturation factor RimM [Wigglesworthia glossinidia]